MNEHAVSPSVVSIELPVAPPDEGLLDRDRSAGLVVIAILPRCPAAGEMHLYRTDSG